MASLMNAALILLTMLFLAPFENLPAAALGAVVIDAMVGLITLANMKRYYHVNRPDWVFFMGAMLGILFLGIISGIVIGVTLPPLLIVERRTRGWLLGRKPGSQAYLDVDRHEGLEQPSGIVVVRLEGPLFFADANRFRDGVRAMVARDGTPPEAVVLDAEAVSLTDTDGADILIEIAEELRAQNAALVLARVESSILDLWRRAGTIEAIGTDRIFPTVHEAVEAIRGTGPERVPPVR